MLNMRKKEKSSLLDPLFHTPSSNSTTCLAHIMFSAHVCFFREHAVMQQTLEDRGRYTMPLVR